MFLFSFFLFFKKKEELCSLLIPGYDTVFDRRKDMLEAQYQHIQQNVKVSHWIYRCMYCFILSFDESRFAIFGSLLICYLPKIAIFERFAMCGKPEDHIFGWFVAICYPLKILSLNGFLFAAICYLLNITFVDDLLIVAICYLLKIERLNGLPFVAICYLPKIAMFDDLIIVAICYLLKIERLNGLPFVAICIFQR